MSSEEISQNLESQKLMEVLRKKVREIFESVRNTYDDSVEKTGPRVWSETLSRSKGKIKNRFAAALESRPIVMNFDEAIKPVEGAKQCVVRSMIDQSTSQRVKIRRMDSVKPLPSMSAWVSTSRNFAVADELTLTHIPYTEGGDREKFVENLVATYNGHVHGYKPTAFANDRMIFDTIQKLTEFFQKETGIEIEKTSKGSVFVEPPDIVFEAFAAEFPDKGTAKELKKHKYSDLVEKFCVEKSKELADEVMPDIDGPNAISTSRERIMHTYASLFCRRCYIYDCNLHGPPSYPHRRKRKPDPPGTEEESIGICGPNCYKLDDLGLIPSGSKKSELKVETAVEPGPSTSKGKKCRQSLPGWSAADETMFRVFRATYADDYCEIAKCLENKTCKQVKEFALIEGQEIVESTLSPPLPKGTKKSGKISQDQHHRFRLMKWARNDGGTVKNTYPYVPCDHPPGFMCAPENCDCAGRNNLCMKFCNCSSSCPNRFPGCRCKAHCNTKQCPCFMAMRECDPDLCTSCGACDFDAGRHGINCTNVAIQRNWKKHLLLAPSDVAGWGIFLKDAVKKGEFIYEYCGELISQDEAERRGKIYDQLKVSYLFNLNSEQAVDATRIGNKIRFANHSTNPNCAAKVMMVNGDHRIGIYAQEDIDAGEELFFDYRYSTQHKLEFVSIERPKAS